MRLLALVPGGIDDQLLFFPTLDDLKRSHPNAQIDVVVEPRAKGAYRVCKSVREVLSYDFEARNSLADWGNLLGVIRDREYDVALCSTRRWSTGFLLWLTGIPTRIGYGGSLGQGFFTHPILLKTSQYEACMYHDLLQGLNVQTECPDLEITVLKQDIEWSETEQKRLGIQSSGYVLIYGGSSQASKNQGIDKLYPVEKWKTILDVFQQKQPNLSLIVIQDPENQAWVSDLLKLAPFLKVTTPSDLGKLAALLAGASLMLCTDSAPMHVAVAVKTAILALFGPTDPQNVLPVSDRFVALKSSSGRMADIAPQAVLEKILGG